MPTNYTINYSFLGVHGIIPRMLEIKKAVHCFMFIIKSQISSSVSFKWFTSCYPFSSCCVL